MKQVPIALQRKPDTDALVKEAQAEATGDLEALGPNSGVITLRRKRGQRRAVVMRRGREFARMMVYLELPLELKVRRYCDRRDIRYSDFIAELIEKAAQTLRM